VRRSRTRPAYRRSRDIVLAGARTASERSGDMKANETLLLDKTRAVEERDADRRLGIYHPEVEFSTGRRRCRNNGDEPGSRGSRHEHGNHRGLGPAAHRGGRKTHPSVVASNDDELRSEEPAGVLERHATGCRPRPSERDRPSVTSHGVGGS
jgi:hypothetical protein